jgi:phosphoribosyl-AMP cyclohydrolase
MFTQRKSVEQVEEGIELSPKFDSDGLLAVVITDKDSGDVLMLGYMNEDALRKTITTGEGHYYSRSRKKLWRKGETSGLFHFVEEIMIDDDQDALWLKVRLGKNAEGKQASCHVGYRSCFYRLVEYKDNEVKLVFTETAKAFDPKKTYGDLPNPTKL